MIVVHHLNQSRSTRILWLLEELDLPYELKRYQRDPRTNLAPEALKQFHPLGKSPVLTDGDQVLAESGLITEYLCDRYDNGLLAPPRSAEAPTLERLRWLYWLHYAEGSAMTPLLLKLVLGRMSSDPSDSPANAFADGEIRLHVAYWNEELGRDGWFAGKRFSAADILMSFPLEAIARFSNGADNPHIEAFVAKIRERPAYKTARQKAEGLTGGT